MPFASLGLPDVITKGVRAAGYKEPTPIQKEAIPVILPGHDLIAAAQTGSGKTAAFLLPILTRLLGRPGALRALVLVPTRELCAQIDENARKYARFAGIRCGAAYGGVPIGPQERMLRYEGVELLIATPGRLLDLQGRQSVALDEVEILVLDEADRMVDMGFAPDLRRILRLLPTKRQTLMFSATMPRELNAVAQEATHSPRRVEVTPPTSTAEKVAQYFVSVSQLDKLDVLDRMLARERDLRAIVFARTKRGADKLERRMKERGHHTVVLHGDRTQGQRERAMLAFKRGRADVLIATDIASRGIDVTGVTHVVNFDVPRSPDDYVHRIGRTGRMHASGQALTFVTPSEEKDAAAIEKSIGLKLPRVRPGDLETGAASKRAHAAKPHGEAHAAKPHAAKPHGEAHAAKPHAAKPHGEAHAAKPHGGSHAAKPHADGHAPAAKSHGSARSHGASRTHHDDPRLRRLHERISRHEDASDHGRDDSARRPRRESRGREESRPRREARSHEGASSRGRHDASHGRASHGAHATPVAAKPAAHGSGHAAPRPHAPAAEHGRRPRANASDRRSRKRL